MDELGTVMAKLSGIRKAVVALLDETARENLPRRSFQPEIIGHQFKQAASLVDRLRILLPTLYDDFQPMNSDPSVTMSPKDGAPTPNHFARHQLEQLRRDIDQIF